MVPKYTCRNNVATNPPMMLHLVVSAGRFGGGWGVWGKNKAVFGPKLGECCTQWFLDTGGHWVQRIFRGFGSKYYLFFVLAVVSYH